MAFTETLTTNRQNWSGDTVTVKVDRQALSWIQFDYEFHLEFLPWPEDVRDILGLGRYAIVSDQWSSPLGYVEAFDDDTFMAAGSGLDRDARDPVEAAVRLLCNIL